MILFKRDVYKEIYGAYGPQGIKLVKQIGKKIQDATGEKWSTFFYSKVYQWQNNEAMKFVLWVAQKIYLQAWTAYSIFKYTKLKSYDKKIIYIYIYT